MPGAPDAAEGQILAQDARWKFNEAPVRAYIKNPLAARTRCKRYERMLGWFESIPGVQFYRARWTRLCPSEGWSIGSTPMRGSKSCR